MDRPGLFNLRRNEGDLAKIRLQALSVEPRMQLRTAISATSPRALARLDFGHSEPKEAPKSALRPPRCKGRHLPSSRARRQRPDFRLARAAGPDRIKGYSRSASAAPLRPPRIHRRKREISRCSSSNTSISILSATKVTFNRSVSGLVLSI